MILDNVVWGFVGCGSVTEKKWPGPGQHAGLTGSGSDAPQCGTG